MSLNVVTQKHTVQWDAPDISLIGKNGGEIASPPLELFGSFWADWVEAVAQGANAPSDYVAASLLAVAGALIGNSVVAQYGAWTEPPILWVVLVGGPSSGKSPAMDAPVRLLENIEQDIGQAVRIDDASAAAAGVRAAESPKGLILINDELPAWWSRFKTLGGEAFWLKAYGARTHIIDRKDKPTIRVPHLAINVLGGAQPDAVRTAITGRENTGFASRCLYVFPEAVKSFRMTAEPDHALADQALRRLAALGDGTHTQPCPLSADAQVLAQAWVERKICDANDADGIWAEWLGKQRGVAMRLALILEHLWWAAESPLAAPAPSTISAKAYQAAADYIDNYAAPMAARTMATAMAPQEDQLATRLAKLIRKAGATRINLRDIRRGALGPAGELADAKRMSKAAEALEAASLIRHVGVRADGRAGRSPALYEVNPALFTQGGR